MIDPKLIARMTEAELAEFDRLLLDSTDPWLPLPGPQLLAYESEADIVGYGGAAGGGKTDLICGAATTKHKRVLIVRSEKAQTEGIVQRLTQVLGGERRGYNSQKGQWQVDVGSKPLIEFGGLDNPGDESRWQGRAHDLKCFDEVTEMREHQVRFCMGWNRSEDPSVKPKVLMTFNPPMDSDGEWVIRFFAPWLDDMHPNPAKPGELRWFTTLEEVDVEVPDGRPFVVVDGEFVYKFNPDDFTPEQIIQPKSRTFIPARIVDNPYYMATGYIATVQAMPEPMRSRLLYGNFKIGREADPFQAIPTAWVDAAMARWKRPSKLPPMDSMGADIAMRGRDKTVIARRHDMWFDEPIEKPGVECTDGPTVASFLLAALRNGAPIHLDLFGVGSKPYGQLMQVGVQVLGVNVGDTTDQKDLTGHFRFRNLRSLYWWRMREALDPDNNTGIELPPNRYLRADLCAPKFRAVGPFIEVESRDDVVKRLGRSPDYASAYVLALLRTPKLTEMQRAARDARRAPDYDPFAQF